MKGEVYVIIVSQLHCVDYPILTNSFQCHKCHQCQVLCKSFLQHSRTTLTISIAVECSSLLILNSCENNLLQHIILYYMYLFSKDFSMLLVFYFFKGNTERKSITEKFALIISLNCQSHSDRNLSCGEYIFSKCLLEALVVEGEPGTFRLQLYHPL